MAILEDDFIGKSFVEQSVSNYLYCPPALKNVIILKEDAMRESLVFESHCDYDSDPENYLPTTELENIEYDEFENSDKRIDNLRS